MIKVKAKQSTADAVMLAFTTPTRSTRTTSPVWGVSHIRAKTGLPPNELKDALAALVAVGELSYVSYAENSSREGVLYGLMRCRSGYYMLPERLKELEQARDERLQKPYWEQARRNILDRYADEVAAEFERLWAEREIREEGK